MRRIDQELIDVQHQTPPPLAEAVEQVLQPEPVQFVAFRGLEQIDPIEGAQDLAGRVRGTVVDGDDSIHAEMKMVLEKVGEAKLFVTNSYERDDLVGIVRDGARRDLTQTPP